MFLWCVYKILSGFLKRCNGPNIEDEESVIHKTMATKTGSELVLATNTDWCKDVQLNEDSKKSGCNRHFHSYRHRASTSLNNSSDRKKNVEGYSSNNRRTFTILCKNSRHRKNNTFINVLN